MIRPKGGKGGTGNHQPGGLSREKREECIPHRTQEGVQKRETDSREELDVREAEALTETGAQGIQTPIGAECTEKCGEGSNVALKLVDWDLMPRCSSPKAIAKSHQVHVKLAVPEGTESLGVHQSLPKAAL